MGGGNVAAFAPKGTPDSTARNAPGTHVLSELGLRPGLGYESADMPEGRRVCSLAVAALACWTTSCGGGAPLLHPAHTLAAGHVSAGAGVSGQFAFRSNEPPPPGPPPMGNDAAHRLEEAVAGTALSPGIAPWVGVRAGLGARTEAGLVYTGRTVRADARHAFENDAYALSVGAGASGVFARPPDSGEQSTGGPGSTTLDANGFGFDVPIIVGWRSTASVVQVWAGARGGVERLYGDVRLEDVPAPAASVTATRWWGGGLVGAAVGLPPLIVAVELDVAYHGVSGSAEMPEPGGVPPPRPISVSGLTVAPAGAIIGKF